MRFIVPRLLARRRRRVPLRRLHQGGTACTRGSGAAPGAFVARFEAHGVAQVLDGPGDFTGGFQWSFNLDQGGAATASATLTVTNVPTPGALALASLGGLLAMRRRTR